MSRTDLVTANIVNTHHKPLTPFCFVFVARKRTRTSPNSEIPTQDRRTSFDGCEGSDPSLAIRRIPETFYAVPHCAANALEREEAVSEKIARMLE